MPNLINTSNVKSQGLENGHGVGGKLIGKQTTKAAMTRTTMSCRRFLACWTL